jgi:hypothetical protein
VSNQARPREGSYLGARCSIEQYSGLLGAFAVDPLENSRAFYKFRWNSRADILRDAGKSMGPHRGQQEMPVISDEPDVPDAGDAP